VELVALRPVAPRRAAQRMTSARLATFVPPALCGLVLSQRDKTHLTVTFYHTGCLANPQ
jgi:hypothetical protein